MHMQQRTAVVPQHAADCVHDNRTATIKDARWNEWLASCLLSMHVTQQRYCQARSTQQIVHDNRTATIKDARLE
jgi:hypothetical protein